MGGVMTTSPLPQAQSLFTDAVQIRRGVLGPENPETLQSMNRLSGALREQGHYPEQRGWSARRWIFSAGPWAGTPRHVSFDHPAGCHSYYEGHYSEAEKLGQQALESKRRILGPEHPDTLWSMVILASISLMRAACPTRKSYTMTLWKFGTRPRARSS